MSIKNMTTVVIKIAQHRVDCPINFYINDAFIVKVSTFIMKSCPALTILFHGGKCTSMKFQTIRLKLFLLSVFYLSTPTR